MVANCLGTAAIVVRRRHSGCGGHLHGNIGGNSTGPTPPRFQLVQIVGRIQSAQHDLFDRGVEGEALVAPDPEKVPPAIAIAGFAIVANHVHNPGHVAGYRLQGNPHGNGTPRGRHLFRCFGRLFADRTPGVVRGQFLEAVPVYGVSAGHFV